MRTRVSGTRSDDVVIAVVELTFVAIIVGGGVTLTMTLPGQPAKLAPAPAPPHKW
jgi:hypothetical protein